MGEFFNEHHRIGIEGQGDLQVLDPIQPALAGLVLGHEGGIIATPDDASPVEASEITPEQIILVRCVIAAVQSQLRAMRELALESHDSARWSEDFPALAQCVCERMHMALDDCMTVLGEEQYDLYRNAITEIKKRRDRER